MERCVGGEASCIDWARAARNRNGRVSRPARTARSASFFGVTKSWMLRSRELVSGLHERYRGLVERCRRFVRTRGGRPVTPQFWSGGLWQGVDETAVNYISAED